MTLKVISKGHSSFAGLFKCNPSHICAAFYQISDAITVKTALGALYMYNDVKGDKTTNKNYDGIGVTIGDYDMIANE